MLVVAHSDLEYTDLTRRTSEVVADLSLHYEVVISSAIVTHRRFEEEYRPFLLNVRGEGVVV